MQIATSKAFTKYYYKYIYRPVWTTPAQIWPGWIIQNLEDKSMFCTDRE